MKLWTLLIVALVVGLSARAQDNRYYVGGNISLGASSYGTSIVVYPEVGMRVNPYLMVGLAAGFDWNNIQSKSDFTMGLIPHVRTYLPIVENFGFTGDTYFAARWTRRQGYDPLISRQTLGFRPGVLEPYGLWYRKPELHMAGSPGSSGYHNRGLDEPLVLSDFSSYFHAVPMQDRRRERRHRAEHAEALLTIGGA